MSKKNSSAGENSCKEIDHVYYVGAHWIGYVSCSCNRPYRGRTVRMVYPGSDCWRGWHAAIPCGGSPVLCQGHAVETLLYAGVYVLVGIVWSFIKWFSFLVSFRDKFRFYKETFLTSQTYRNLTGHELDPADLTAPVPAALTGKDTEVCITY